MLKGVSAILINSHAFRLQMGEILSELRVQFHYLKAKPVYIFDKKLNNKFVNEMREVIKLTIPSNLYWFQVAK
jgi:hypothetical protein